MITFLIIWCLLLSAVCTGLLIRVKDLREAVDTLKTQNWLAHQQVRDKEKS